MESVETVGSVMKRLPVMVHGRMPVFDEDAVVGTDRSTFFVMLRPIISIHL